MARPSLLTIGMGSLHRRILIPVLGFILIGLTYHLDAIPSRDILASSKHYIINRLPFRQELEDLEADTAISQDYQQWVSADEDRSPCAPELDYLKLTSLTNHIKHTRRCVKPLFSDIVDRNEVTDTKLSLITRTQSLLLSEPCTIDVDSIPCDPLELPVPPPYPKNQGQYTHLIFGVATTYARLRDSRPTFAHWLSNSGATLVGLVAEQYMELFPLDLVALKEEYKADGIDLTIVMQHGLLHTTEQSHVMVIRDMLIQVQSTSTETHWFGILDDDTFFPSLYALSATLSQYDHTRPQYLGQTTESAHILPIGILGGFGGAGIFLSLPLVEQIEPHLDSCLVEYPNRGGDMQIMSCIYEHSTAKLKMVDGLYQMDLVGDVSGFYEAGRQILSLHHWKSWHWLPVDRMAAVTRLCGDCFLQRFSFLGDDRYALTVLNNGYSINFYEVGIGELPDLSRTEQTWDAWLGVDAWGDYQWRLGPLRPKVEKDKKSYYLETAVQNDDGGLTQVYVHRENGQDDEVIELVWQI
ncbi:hypothetical protein VP1G_05484 [Cytospora mali]|uniref:Glycosyltransferase family 31 protein n=1 Tax=Cytospora mali TaxID=578113 RepID=A0A194V2N7_CYTMA|nr:hypothetical protein VP1G_05484 [Valsa mali var. pyri (nom. inval.)]